MLVVGTWKGLKSEIFFKTFECRFEQFFERAFSEERSTEKNVFFWRNSSRERNYFNEEAVSYVLADGDSEVSAPPLRRRIRTRGGITAPRGRAQGRGRQVNQVTRHDRELQLEDTWSRIDEPVIHEFAAEAGLQLHLDKENTKILDYLKLFIPDNFYELISEQTNLYAHQYI